MVIYSNQLALSHQAPPSHLPVNPPIPPLTHASNTRLVTPQANAQLAEGSRAKAEALSSSEATLQIKRSQLESMRAALAEARRHVSLHAAEAAQRTDDLTAAGEELDLRSEQLSLAHQQVPPPTPNHHHPTPSGSRRARVSSADARSARRIHDTWLVRARRRRRSPTPTRPTQRASRRSPPRRRSATFAQRMTHSSRRYIRPSRHAPRAETRAEIAAANREDPNDRRVVFSSEMSRRRHTKSWRRSRSAGTARH